MAGYTFEKPPADPFALLRSWLDRAPSSGVGNPQAVSLATVGTDGSPSSRFVAIAEVTADGVVFATSADGPKGRELSGEPRVALTAFWAATEQQYRIRGVATALDDEQSDRHFVTLPRAARAAVIVARQSEPLESWSALDRDAEELDRSGADLPRPAHWRSWSVTASEVQFWGASPNHVHRRLAYTRTADGWMVRRLQP